MMFKGARFVGVAVIGTVGLLLLAACGSSSSGPGGSSTDSSGTSSGGTSSGGTPRNPADPCSLLTIDQASEIIGEPAERGHLVGQECLWGSTKGQGPFVRIGLVSKATYDGLAGRVPPPGVTQAPVAGIGDDAFAADIGQGGHLLYFRKGDQYFKVDAFAVRGPLKDLEAEKQIAQYILQRL